jgi:hypothetical protein
MKIVMRCWMVAAVILSAASLAYAGTVDPFAVLNGGAAGPTNWRILSMGGCTQATTGNKNLATGCDTGSSSVIMQTNAQVYDGNVGVSPNGNLNLTNTGTSIVGNVYVDGNSTHLNQGAGTHIYGTIYDNSSSTNTMLINATTAAMNAYNDATNDITCQGVTEGATNCTGITSISASGAANSITLKGGAGLNIVDLTSLALSNDAVLTLSDSVVGSTFLIDITGGFAVNTGASIVESGSLSNYNVLFNLEGTGTVCISSGGSSCIAGPSSPLTSVNGIILAPFRVLTIDAANVDGEVISGENLTLSNTGVVDAPEPATWMLVSTGLAGLGLRIRRIKRRTAPRG